MVPNPSIKRATADCQIAAGLFSISLIPNQFVSDVLVTMALKIAYFAKIARGLECFSNLKMVVLHGRSAREKSRLHQDISQFPDIAKPNVVFQAPHCRLGHFSGMTELPQKVADQVGQVIGPIA